MELRLNLVFLGLVVATAGFLTASEPMAALDPAAKATRRLGRLEDAFASAPGDETTLLALLGAYADVRRPELVVATVARATAPARDTAEVAHRLARAEESLGRFARAKVAADRAIEACVHADRGARGCPDARLAVYRIHRSALVRIVAMGIEDPRDARIRTAYELALRPVTVRLGG